MRGGDGDDDGGVADGEDAGAVQQGDAADHRPAGADLGGDGLEPGLGLLLVGLVHELSTPVRSPAWSRAVPQNTATAPQSGRPTHSVAAPTGNGSADKADPVVPVGRSHDHEMLRRSSASRHLAPNWPPAPARGQRLGGGSYDGATVPGTWPDDEGGGEDDHDERPLAPPVHPDDRLWRHPSEVAWGLAPSAVTPTPSGRTGGPAPRLWALALTSALTGAALTLGVVALLGGLGIEPTERVVDARAVWLGIEGIDLDADRPSILGLAGVGAGIVVERVLPHSPAAAAGLRAGDVLVALDDEPILSMSDLVLALRDYRPGDEATLERPARRSRR